MANTNPPLRVLPAADAEPPRGKVTGRMRVAIDDNFHLGEMVSAVRQGLARLADGRDDEERDARYQVRRRRYLEERRHYTANVRLRRVAESRHRTAFAPSRPTRSERLTVLGRRRPAERRADGERSGQDPGDDPEPGHAVEDFRLILVHEKHVREPVSLTSPRCRCDRDRPYTAPDWDIEPDGGQCRRCDRPLRERDVRRWHAIALAERARLVAKGWRR
jgi:hypothetical protein